jgi:hypothetical protein
MTFCFWLKRLRRVKTARFLTKFSKLIKIRNICQKLTMVNKSLNEILSVQFSIDHRLLYFEIFLKTLLYFYLSVPINPSAIGYGI